MRRFATLGASALAALVIVLGPGSTAADAHDALVGSDPADGAVLTVAPQQVVLTFTADQLEVGAVVEVTGTDGSRWTAGEPAVSGPTVTQPLAQSMPSGAFQVVWRSVSADGHPISGELGFSIEAPEAAPTPEPSAAPASTDEPGTDVSGTESSTEPSAEPSTEPRADEPGTATPTPVADDDRSRLRPSTSSWLLAGTAVVAAAVVAGLVAQRRGEARR
ncbi:copper resistance CopC family protein [Cellulomonas sp. KRMCY2]|uniref:copper resistance CopC family protein n=1 Tax=Cellulomonas sp. KRMCY2 TaxID=1304865 RepID=UPI00045E58F1|nr:copper resistance CopC family protein [Cellulomonas sp. KRMCY2]